MDIKTIRKYIKQCEMPKEYEYRIEKILESLFNHDYTIHISIREDSGKTTNALLLGLIFFAIDNTCTIYQRSDNKQITVANVQTLYKTIVKFDYISKIFNNNYNDIIYKQMEHKFYLVKRDENGEIIDECINYCCHCVSLENAFDYKSGLTAPNYNYIVFDEFLDTKRSMSTQMEELQHNISTFGRNRPECHCLLLGNNVDKFSRWWEEFTIEDEIDSLNYGGVIDKRTELGTTLHVEMLEMSERQKTRLIDKLVRFSGFNTPKMNAFNGLGAWQGKVYPHIPTSDYINNSDIIYDHYYILHRNRYIKVNVYCHKDNGYYIFMHYSKKPRYDDIFILTLEPLQIYDIFGFGQYINNEEIKNQLLFITQLLNSNKAYYSTNSVGDLFNNYMLEFKRR